MKNGEYRAQNFTEQVERNKAIERASSNDSEQKVLQTDGKQVLNKLGGSKLLSNKSKRSLFATVKNVHTFGPSKNVKNACMGENEYLFSDATMLELSGILQFLILCILSKSISFSDDSMIAEVAYR